MVYIRYNFKTNTLLHKFLDYVGGRMPKYWEINVHLFFEYEKNHSLFLIKLLLLQLYQVFFAEGWVSNLLLMPQ